MDFKDFFGQSEAKLESFFDSMLFELYGDYGNDFVAHSYGHYFIIGTDDFAIEIYHDGNIEMNGSNPSINILTLVKFLEDNEIKWG